MIQTLARCWAESLSIPSDRALVNPTQAELKACIMNTNYNTAFAKQ